ncbi:MAG: hypothetical protein C0423_21600 [Methylibium sp.]|nr:hypothetical protein [Methylibium sp.]
MLAASWERGLTLLELLIVLMLMGLLTALAAPRVDAQLESARHRALQRRVQAVVDELPLSAFKSGRALRVDAAELQSLIGQDVPDGYRVELLQPLLYGPTGLASGGELRVSRTGGSTMTWYVTPFTGRLTASRPLQSDAR